MGGVAPNFILSPISPRSATVTEHKAVIKVHAEQVNQYRKTRKSCAPFGRFPRFLKNNINGVYSLKIPRSKKQTYAFNDRKSFDKFLNVVNITFCPVQNSRSLGQT